MITLAPGIWISDDNSLHIDATAVCKSLGCAPSPMNQDTIERIAIGIVREHFGADLPVEVREACAEETRPS